MIFIVLSGGISFSENMILFFRRKIKNDIFCIYGKDGIFFLQI